MDFRQPGTAATRTVATEKLAAEGIESFKRAARAYAENLPAWGRHHLRTKPFYTVAAHVEEVQLGYFHDAATIVSLLALPGGSSILDVACGPGWLSEFFYRFGYRVTGVDIAEDLLAIARERIATLPFQPLERDPTWAQFHCTDLETETVEGQFDGIVLYDCLHHFVNAKGVLQKLVAALQPWGKLVIKEGAMPRVGSEGEAALLRETAELGTLEAPFAVDALERLLNDAGFPFIRRYIDLPSAVETSKTELRALKKRLRSKPVVNFLVCRKSEVAVQWGATIRCLGAQVRSPDHRTLWMKVAIRNAGGETWRADQDLVPGSVALGLRAVGPGNEVVEEYRGRTPLPRDLGPGEEAVVEVDYPLEGLSADIEALTVDVVLQGHFWFVDKGSVPERVEINSLR